MSKLKFICFAEKKNEINKQTSDLNKVYFFFLLVYFDIDYSVHILNFNLFYLRICSILK